MVTSLFCVFDNVADTAIVIGSAPNEATFIRQNLPYLSKINENFLNDFSVYEIATFKESSMAVSPLDKPRLISWDAYNAGMTSPAVEK